MTLVDAQFLKRINLSAYTYEIITLVGVKGVGGHNRSGLYTLLNLYIPGKSIEKDGTIGLAGRPVVDIRGLNYIYIRDIYPLPTIDSIIASIKGKSFLSILDI